MRWIRRVQCFVSRSPLCLVVTILILRTVFVRTRDYNLLAGILLAVTGPEAIFANLGQFNAASIRVSSHMHAYSYS